MIAKTSDGAMLHQRIQSVQKRFGTYKIYGRFIVGH